jgi:hypothetical protein
MNAASRELVNALQLHPNSPKSVANVRRLLLSAGSDNEMKALKYSLIKNYFNYYYQRSFKHISFSKKARLCGPNGWCLGRGTTIAKHSQATGR